MELKIMTFNIRYDTEMDGKNHFAGRSNMIVEFLRRERPDLIGFQESVPVIRRFLAEELTEYTFLAVDANEARHNDVAIAYRHDRFDLFGLEQFWLSPTPEVPDTRYEDQSPFPRMATLATLIDREEGRRIAFLNSHLDHIGEEAKRLGAALLLARLARYADVPCFLTGDFNSYPDSAPVREILADPRMRELTAPLGAEVATYHGYGTIARDCKIDYIFATEDVTPLPAGLTVHTDHRDGIYLSDHYPISVTVTL